MITEIQQNELDKIERRILISLFGSETIPEPTAIFLKMFNVNPNDYINKFENFISPFMNDLGMVDGTTLRKILSVSRYSEVTKYLNIPNTDFYLSDVINSAIIKFIPGVELC